MKPTLKMLTDLLKELISASDRRNQGYGNLRLIPVPVKSGQRFIPSKSNA